MLKCIQQLRALQKAPPLSTIDFSGKEDLAAYKKARAFVKTQPGYSELSPAEKINALMDECILRGIKIK